ncbi:MAG TPA: hypothetical protein PKV48_03540 [Thermodesulfobacteriota bacterium]|nr:hypothetical protein [Thermodesulfobacteriota bacterium]
MARQKGFKLVVAIRINSGYLTPYTTSPAADILPHLFHARNYPDG